jgi:hypothetical protein
MRFYYLEAFFFTLQRGIVLWHGERDPLNTENYRKLNFIPRERQ